MMLPNRTRVRRTGDAVNRNTFAEDRPHHLTPEESAELEHWREVDPARAAALAGHQLPTFPERLADAVAGMVGSWLFLAIQSIVFAAWIATNVIGWVAEWDPYPFILLNLLLSFQAAYFSPIIMMSQNRQARIDRRHAMSDSEINLQAALEIKSLHEKVDGLIDAIGQLRKEIGSSTTISHPPAISR
jgi:uncharacterized membrane protein